MKTFAILAATAASLAMAGTAHAGTASSGAEGKLQVKLLGTAVLPDGKVKSVKDNTAGFVPAAVAETKANDNFVPTVAIEYFFTPNVSLETICCVTGHHVIGAGPTVFLMINDRPSAAVAAAGVTRTHMSSELGVAVQAGADVAIGNGYSLSLDAKKYWVSTDATFYTAAGTGLKTRHRLDPWVLSAGIAYRF